MRIGIQDSFYMNLVFDIKMIYSHILSAYRINSMFVTLTSLSLNTSYGTTGSIGANRKNETV